MKLQRSISRRLGGKEYAKHQIVVPNSTVEQLGWRHGDYLEVRVTPRGLLIYRAERRQRFERPSYQQFKEAVTDVLMTLPQGCTWSELRSKTGLNQLTPSPLWVKRMEGERSLERIRDPATSRVVWKIPEERLILASRSTLNGWTERSTGTTDVQLGV